MGIVGEDLVVFGHGEIVIFLRVGDFAEVELGVAGQIGAAVVADVILKLGAGEIIFAASDVAEAVRIERVGGRRASRWQAG